MISRMFAVPFIAGLFIGSAVSAVAAEAYADTEYIESLRFSNTARWDLAVYKEKSVHDPIVGEAVFDLRLPPYPANMSKETKEEIAYMHELEAVRSLEQLRNIHEELVLTSAMFGDMSYSELIEERPRTGALLGRAVAEITAAIVNQKEQFDRVRPNKLDETLTPAIPVPGHPAYPSGHAGQSMIIALILGELDHERAHAYIASAKRIAHNREIAGVHYPSDSFAGQLLAEHYFALLKTSEEFQSLLAEAKSEW